MPTILGKKFGSEKSSGPHQEETRLRNSREKVVALSLKFARTKKLNPNPLCRASGSRNLEAQQRTYHTILVAIVSQNSFVLVFVGVSHNYRAIRCKMGYRIEVPV